MIRSAIAKLFGTAAIKAERVYAESLGDQAREQLLKELESRAYEAGRWTLDSASWIGSDGSADSETRNTLAIIRGRARDAEENGPYAEAYVGELISNVLGPEGMTLQNQAREFDENGNEVLDKIANGKIHDGYDEWKQLGVCDVTGELTFYDCEQLALRRACLDGEAIVRKVKDYRGNRFRFALQMIEADALDVNKNEVLANGNIVTMGVEKNAWKRPVAYWILKKHPGDFFSPNTPDPDKWERVPADQIVHLRRPKRIGETRSVSWLHGILNQMAMLDGYEKAEVTAARASACKGGVIESTSPESQGTVPGLAKFLQRVGAKVWELLPAQVRIIPPGWTFKAISPTHPNGNFGEFKKAVLRAFASFLRVSYMAISGDLSSASYSSSRTGMLTERDNWKVLQKWFIDHFEKPIFSDWLLSALTFQAITLPVTRYQKFNRPYFQGRRWAWVDPARDLKAIETELRLRLTSPQQVIAERSPEYTLADVLNEWKAAQDMAESIGVSLEGALQSVLQNVPNDPEKEEAEEQPKTPTTDNETNPQRTILLPPSRNGNGRGHAQNGPLS
jgi:lambda family phage portal protein